MLGHLCEAGHTLKAEDFVAPLRLKEGRVFDTLETLALKSWILRYQQLTSQRDLELRRLAESEYGGDVMLTVQALNRARAMLTKTAARHGKPYSVPALPDPTHDAFSAVRFVTVTETDNQPRIQLTYRGQASAFDTRCLHQPTHQAIVLWGGVPGEIARVRQAGEYYGYARQTGYNRRKWG